MRANVWAALLAVLMASQLLGCSWALTEGAPPVQERESELECTTSRKAPILDTVVAASLAIIGGVYFVLGFQKSTPETSRSEFITVGVGGFISAGIFGWSARTGFRRTRECRKAHKVAQAFNPIETESGKPLDHPVDHPVESDIDK